MISRIWKMLLDTKADNDLDIEIEENMPEDEDDDDDEDIGKKPDRSKIVSRKRFDQVNAKAQQLAKLIKSGKAKVNDSGDVEIIVPEKPTVKKDEPVGENKKVNFNDLVIKKGDVDEGSWPLVDKLQRQVGHLIPLMNHVYDIVDILAEQQAIMREFAEHGALKKDSEFNKLMKGIEENDEEFKALFKGKRGQKYYAAKRAFSKLEDLRKNSTPDKEKSKSAKFIITKGDSGNIKRTVLSEEKMAEMSKTAEGRVKLNEYERELWKKTGGK